MQPDMGSLRLRIIVSDGHFHAQIAACVNEIQACVDQIPCAKFTFDYRQAAIHAPQRCLSEIRHEGGIAERPAEQRRPLELPYQRIPCNGSI